MPSLLCAHLPWLRLAEHRSFVLTERINPELFLPAEALESMDWELLTSFSHELAGAGLSCTIHGPFMDLNPGSVDPAIRESSGMRVDQTLRAAGLLKARVVVFHPGYSRLSHGSVQDVWVENSIAFWRERLPAIRAAECCVALENIFEDEPSTLRRVIEGIGDPLVGHCFDVGHFNMFARVSLEEWFAELGRHILESHLHDNFGQSDDHLPVGDGAIDFTRVSGLLHRFAPQAVWTLEAHSRQRLERSLKAIQQYLREEL
ncbi:sugar phosphate isomerase/epimerase family protein [Trichlorobacter ammonificans]|uniref:Sugar phosphate isomerase/epimerase n=1 Tax=Trichlorobacter ammonificans TaxID=2916410 RepID=A0ABN8HG83_9BACT|nr:sugar phosphate isomerase/epimerase family protein [Trichlorobacter ammonificans]CAH2030430.1 Sugar phosphate isomerase/epimerase [Trichlorobacter ammonificans]